MSVGELINLYRSKELIINPNFQRYFVWDDTQKSRFIESLLLNIPIPSIFVYQDGDGIWELIDGLQRLSTIFEFVGVLRTPDGDGTEPPSVLTGTKMLPDLADRSWEDIDDVDSRPIGSEYQLAIKRSRMRIEILKSTSDTQAKFELFQRLNTGGTQLEPQEVRNAVMVMIDKNFHDWIHEVAHHEQFIDCTDLSDNQVQRQYNVELALRFFVYRNVPYQSGFDVHEYIDDGMIQIADSDTFDRNSEEEVFLTTFNYIYSALGSNAFKKWTGSEFKGKFLISAFEAIAYGLSESLEEYEDMDPAARDLKIKEKVKSIWKEEVYSKNSGAGVRGTTRLRNLLPFVQDYFSTT
jgi:hypothetical protein